MKNMLVKVADKVKEDSPKHVDFGINWKGKVFRFDGSDNDVMLQAEYSMIRLKKDDTPHARRTTETISVAMSYCPFCGEKFENKER
jgi:hypothetical protein